MLLFSAFMLGVYGMLMTALWISIDLLSLTSFGTPYLAPVSPWRPKDWVNYLWRVPWPHLRRRLTESRSADLSWMDPT
jgi:spore germination protein KA